MLLEIQEVLAELQHFYLLVRLAVVEHMYISPAVLALQQEKVVQPVRPALVMAEIVDTMEKIQQSLNLMTE